jgi:hypothetical protein
LTLVDTLAAVREDGRQRTATCPAHADGTASLSVGIGDDNRALLHCFAGCTFEAIVEAAHLTRADLNGRRDTGSSPLTIAASYDYTDEAGVLLYQVCRLVPKSFRQRRPDGSGGWTWKLGDVRRVLYRLPRLIAHQTVYVTEGEKDSDRLAALGLASTTNAGGAGNWRDEYTQQLVAAGVTTVIVLPDNDDPGRYHAEVVATSCRAAGLTTQIVSLPNLPLKGDVSDWLDAGGTRDALERLSRAGETAPPTSSASAPASLADVEAIFARWIRDPDPLPTRAVLAAYLANRRLDGDPVWLMLVGGSGVGKTERLAPLAVMPDVVLESSITGPAALLSGTGKKERAKDATGGLLRKLPEGGGVLLLKDFTSIIDMHRDARAEVLAALREVYDGRWDRSVGAEGGRTLTWIGHLGLVAGCTTAIDSAHGVISAMGTRFVLIRLQGDRHIALSALEHVGCEKPMRDELRAAVAGLLRQPAGEPYVVADARDHLAALGSYVALARSPVDRDSQGEIRLVLDPEAPTRIVKMLAQFWRAAGLLGLSRADAWALVLRIGLDSVPKLRRHVLDYLAATLTAPSTTTIAEAVEHPSRTTRRALEDLAAHRVVRRLAGGEGKADRWELTEQTRNWLEVLTVPVSSDLAMSGTVPVSSAPMVSAQEPVLPMTSLIEPKIPNDDKTGKVTNPRVAAAIERATDALQVGDALHLDAWPPRDAA